MDGLAIKGIGWWWQAPIIDDGWSSGQHCGLVGDDSLVSLLFLRGISI